MRMPSATSKSYLHWVQCARVIAQFGFFSSTFFCLMLILLTLSGVKRNFGSYTRLLIIFPAVGIVYATIEFLIYPHVHSYNSGYFYYSTSHPFNISNNAVTWWLSIYTGVYASTIAMLAVQFVYRYWAVFDRRKLRFFQGWRFLFCLVYSSLFGFQWVFGHYYFEKVDEYAASYMRIEMLEKYNIDTRNVASLALVVYDEQGRIRWWNSACILNMTSTIVIQYTIISYCAYFMYRRMEDKLQVVSEACRKVHTQFFKTLVLQIITPTASLFSPLLFIMYLPFFNLEINIPTGIILCSFTIYPAMDAIIVMYVVTDYRKAMKRAMRRLMDRMYKWLSLADVDRSTYAVRYSTPAASSLS